MASFFLLIDKSVSPFTVDQDSLNQDCFFVDYKSGCHIVSDSRIDYRRELAGKLGIKWKEAEGFSDRKLILFAYLKWGEACLSHLYGDFSFVIWDPNRDEVLCARDHFGCRPLYYVDQPGFLAVASQISAFKSLPGFRFEIREQYILDSICSIEITETLSAYKGISKLKPAHYLKQNSGQLSDQYRYWDLRINENYGGLTLEEASDGLRDRIIEAVRQRSNTHGQIGVELSGGLDSSGIASVLTMLSEQNVRLNAFTHSISSDGGAQQMFLKSEMEFSTALVEKYSSIRQFKITEENSKGSYKALIEALYSLNKPINLHYAMNSDLLFEVAGNLGTSIIFSGLGGDEGITNNGSGYFNELIRHGQHSKLRDDIKSIVNRRGSRFYRQLIKHYINYYAPWVLNFNKKDWRKAWYRSFALQKSLARKYRMKKRFFNTNSFPGNTDVRALQYFRLMYPNIPERIEETSLLAQQHGIEYRYPFLDVKLLEFFYSLPSEYKYRNGMGRYLFRKAMEDILPEKIRMRTSKGGNTIPNVFARVLKDEEIFREIIAEGRTENHYHYVDYDVLNDMLDSFKKVGELKQQDYGLRAFQSPMSVLILQKWQREGKIDIGIKC
jgi:asparagine synthase (glutamine-hydrolysing)